MQKTCHVDGGVVAGNRWQRAAMKSKLRGAGAKQKAKKEQSPEVIKSAGRAPSQL